MLPPRHTFRERVLGDVLAQKKKKKVIQEKLGHESQEKSEFDLEIYEKWFLNESLENQQSK